MISLILIFIYSSGATSQDLATIRAPHTIGSICITQYTVLQTHPTSSIPLRKRQALLDLSDRLRGVQSLRTRPAAVQDSVASVQAHAVVERFFAFGGAFITRVVEPSIGL